MVSSISRGGRNYVEGLSQTGEEDPSLTRPELQNKGNPRGNFGKPESLTNLRSFNSRLPLISEPLGSGAFENPRPAPQPPVSPSDSQLLRSAAFEKPRPAPQPPVRPSVSSSSMSTIAEQQPRVNLSGLNNRILRPRDGGIGDSALRDQSEIKARQTTPRPHGEALGKIIPEVPKPAKGLRKMGRWIGSDNENAPFHLANDTKPFNGMVSGLTTAHVRNVQSASIATGAHHVANTLLATHASATACVRQRRYRNNLKKMSDHDDLRRVKIGDGVYLSQIAAQKDFKSRNQLVNAIVSHDPARHPDDALNKMRDVLISRHIADVQGFTRFSSNLKRVALSLTGVGASVGLAAGTHGLSHAAIAGGAILSGQTILDNRSAALSIKQYYRDKKETRIADVATLNVLRSRTPATADAWERETARARYKVNQQNISRFVPISFGHINERKSTAHKKEEVDLVSKRAAELVVGIIQETNQRRLKNIYTDPMSSATTSRRSLDAFYREAVLLNPDLGNACQLMRDLGMSKAEACAWMRSAVGAHLAQAKSAQVLDDFEKSSWPILRIMSEKPDAMLKSAIGSAMGRR